MGMTWPRLKNVLSALVGTRVMVSHSVLSRENPRTESRRGSRWSISFGDEYCEYLFAPRVVQRLVD